MSACLSIVGGVSVLLPLFSQFDSLGSKEEKEGSGTHDIKPSYLNIELLKLIHVVLSGNTGKPERFIVYLLTAAALLILLLLYSQPTVLPRE